MLRDVMLALAASKTVKRTVTAVPVSAAMVRRFVAGETVAAAIAAVRRLVEAGLNVTVDYLGEDVTDVVGAAHTRNTYLELLRGLHAADLCAHAEVSIKASALGLACADGSGNADPDAWPGEQVALANARSVAAAAAEVNTTVTVDAEEHTRTDATMRLITALRADYPDVGAVVQAQLRRCVADCRDLAGPQSRVRLCKGAYREPANAAFPLRRDIDLSYVRCMKVLLAGDGFPMLATHDPRLIDIAAVLAHRYGRAQGSYEYQMLYGVRPDEQARLAAAGETVRVYVPFGDAWYGYLTRRMAEKPANAAVFVRALATRK